jgi:Ca2+-binding EF-hand superfamily protein
MNIIAIVATHESVIKDNAAFFSSFDEGKDGRISRDEFIMYMDNNGLSAGHTH